MSAKNWLYSSAVVIAAAPAITAFDIPVTKSGQTSYINCTTTFRNLNKDVKQRNMEEKTGMQTLNEKPLTPCIRIQQSHFLLATCG